jgi:hypothetical protein
VEARAVGAAAEEVTVVEAEEVTVAVEAAKVAASTETRGSAGA